MSEHKIMPTNGAPCPMCGSGYLLYFEYVTPFYVCSNPDCNYQITISKKLQKVYKHS